VGFAYNTDESQTFEGMELVKDTTGLFKLDTRIPGNRNTGHLFTNDNVSGRIGRALSEDERFAIIEYIKSL
jgi:hypothetical protein